MEDSILDKVLSSKQVTEMQEFQPSETISLLLKQLSTKEADVLRRRFGLQDTEMQTLENIGKYYNVTRERIRQIENLAVKKIREMNEFRGIIGSVEHVLHNVFHQSGGFLTEDRLFDKLLSNQKINTSNQQAILFMLAKLLSEKFSKHPPTEHIRLVWRIFSASLDFLHSTLEHLHEVIEKHERPVTFEEIYRKIQERDYFKEHVEKLSEEVIASYLDISQKLNVNPFGEYGFTHWGSIMPKRMNDKIYIILKKSEKPMHFMEIAKQITKTFKRQAYPPTVHNELILNEEYILVGRGIYALKEWGYKPGVVADVLVDILKKEERPLTREELVERVLRQRIVKRNTIHLALTNKKFFKKNPDNTYEIDYKALEASKQGQVPSSMT